MPQDATARLLRLADQSAIDAICQGSPWMVAYFSPAELPRLLATRPGIGIFTDRGQMRAFALATSLVAPACWLGGFGVPWHERQAALDLLDVALPAFGAAAFAAGARVLYYSGNDLANDWLREPLRARGFRPAGLLRSYDKIGVNAPTTGNLAVTVRPFTGAPAELAALLAIEDLAFVSPWRHDEREFREILTDYPFFVVAADAAGIAGYLFASVEESVGFLVRIAVHPSRQGQGIGARLLAEAMRYFAAEGAGSVLLNTQEDNGHAQRLYEWFGFARVPQQGFVLARDLAQP